MRRTVKKITTKEEHVNEYYCDECKELILDQGYIFCDMCNKHVCKKCSHELNSEKYCGICFSAGQRLIHEIHEHELKIKYLKNKWLVDSLKKQDLCNVKRIDFLDIYDDIIAYWSPKNISIEDDKIKFNCEDRYGNSSYEYDLKDLTYYHVYYEGINND